MTRILMGVVGCVAFVAVLAATAAAEEDDGDAAEPQVRDGEGDVIPWPHMPPCSEKDGNLDILEARLLEPDAATLEAVLVVRNLSFEEVNRCVWAVEWRVGNVTASAFFSFLNATGDYVLGFIDNREFYVADGLPFTGVADLSGSYRLGEPGEIRWNVPKRFVGAENGTVLNETHARTFYRVETQEGWIIADRAPQDGWGDPFVVTLDPPPEPKPRKDRGVPLLPLVPPAIATAARAMRRPSPCREGKG